MFFLFLLFAREHSTINTDHLMCNNITLSLYVLALVCACVCVLGKCAHMYISRCLYLHKLTYTHSHSTAPHRRPDLHSAVPTMHGNPNFTRGAPGRSTYAYGTRRPQPQVMHHFRDSPSGASSQPTPGPSSGGFFKRLIPSRFSRR